MKHYSVFLYLSSKPDPWIKDGKFIDSKEFDLRKNPKLNSLTDSFKTKKIK